MGCYTATSSEDTPQTKATHELLTSSPSVGQEFYFGPTAGASIVPQDHRHPTIANNYAQQQQQQQQNQIGSFYALEDELTPIPNGALSDNGLIVPINQQNPELEPVLLHSSNLELASPINGRHAFGSFHQPNGSYSKQKVENLVYPTSRPSPKLKEQQQLQQRKKVQLYHGDVNIVKPQTNWQLMTKPNHVFGPTNQNAQNISIPIKWNGQTVRQNHEDTRQAAKLKNLHQYQSSIVKRPKFVNLSSLIKPGEVLLSKKANHQPNVSVSSVSVHEIEDLLQRLKPLAMSTKDKAISIQNSHNLTPDAIKSPDIDEPDDVGENDESEEEIGDDNVDKMEHILPSSHLFGGSVSSIKNRNTANVRRPPVSQSSDNSIKTISNDDLAFLRSLSALGSHLTTKTPPDNPSSEQFYDFIPKVRSRKKIVQSTKSSSTNSIPIEWLVDQLMSSSRQATFGIQHDDLHQPESEDADSPDSGGLLEQDDDEYEDDDSDHDTGSGLAMIDDGALQTQETSPSESRLFPQTNYGVNFSSIANKSNSWVPLGPLALFENTSQKVISPDNNIGRRKKRNKMARKKQYGQGSKDDVGLIIGGTKLSRVELIRLIGIVNKMASKKKPSKEREASRRLLRFLVRLALDNFKQSNKKINRKKIELSREEDVENSRDPVRDSLRSLLMGPELETTKIDNTTKISIKLQPWRVKTLLENEAKEDSESEARDRQEEQNVQQPSHKSLVDISEDLEKYFDNDFFEDLADKTAAKNSSSLSTDKPRNQEPPRQGGSSKLSYILPVPIYGQKQIEDADEDDVELDHVRLPLRTVAARPDHSSKRKSRKKRNRARSESLRNHKSRGNHKLRRRRPSVADKDDDKEGSDDKDDDQEDDAKPRRKRNGARALSRRRRLKMRPSLDTEGHDHQDESPSEAEQQNIADENNVNEEPNDNETQVTGSEQKKTSHNGQEPETKGAKERPARQEVQKNTDKKRKKRRRRPQRRLKTGVKAGYNLEELDRDEIPAPIVAGRSPLTLKKAKPTKEPTGSLSDDAKVKSSETSKSLADTRAVVTKNEKGLPKTHQKTTKAVSHGNSTIKTSAKQQASKKRLDKKSNHLPLKEESDEPVGQEPQHGESDVDYYNEGTSYSGVCKDDGKCKVTLQSSNPKLGKALKTQDQPEIVKHLDKWMREEPD